MVSPQRASGSLRNERQIQRAIDQTRTLAVANDRGMSVLKTDMAKQLAALRAEIGAAATGASGDVESFLEEIVIVFGGGDADG